LPNFFGLFNVGCVSLAKEVPSSDFSTVSLRARYAGSSVLYKPPLYVLSKETHRS
jgi:hypothetical protein